MSTMEEEDDNATGSGIPRWVIYAGIGLASYVTYKTLFQETKFVYEHQYHEQKGDDYTPEYIRGEKHYVTNPWDEKPIKRARRGSASFKPARIFEVFKKSVDNSPNSICWKKEYLKPNSSTQYEWKTWTRKQIYDLTQQAARAFIACGLKTWESVSIIGFNSPQWVLADLGAIYAGGITAGVYTTNNPGQCKYIALHSKSTVIVLENKKQLDKFLQIRNELPDLKVIVVWDIDQNDPLIAESNRNNNNAAKVMHWDEFMKLGNDKKTIQELNTEKKKRIDAIKPGQCCTLIYTSGTTGPPKAVMLSHDNVTWTARTILNHVQNFKKDGSPHASISYLPLSHIAAQLIDIWVPMVTTAYEPQIKTWDIYFARPTALKGTLSLTLKEARPTIFFGVPRVWEKIQEALIKKARENPVSGTKQMLINWLKNVCLKGYYSQQLGGDMTRPFGYTLAEKILISKVKHGLGFDRIQCTFTGAAPTSIATLEFWGSLGLNVIEGYGMSECTGLHTLAVPYHCKIGTVGTPFNGVIVLLDNDSDRDKPGHGEICMRGRNVMMGYMYDLEKTKRTIDEDGYLHSGDVGMVIEEYNLLKVTGRIKELIITAGGENIAPRPIEDYLKAECEAISNVMVIGDRKKYLVCLITLKVVQNKNTGQFENVLDGAAKSVDDECKTVDDARKSEKWKMYIENAIKKYNNDKEHCVSRAQKVQYFKILDKDFSVETGELTATMKLKRTVVAKKFEQTIESMYGK
eukprot:185054_1